MALRYDIGALAPARKLPDGRLVAEGHLTRAGIFLYWNADGSTRRELRLPEDVFRDDSLETFAFAPVTDDHPPEFLNAGNARKYAVGAVGERVRRDEDHVRARITVFDAETIAKMESGKCALSCGYEVDLDETPGEHPVYGKYDAVQKNIRGNHVAIVDVGRAGDTVRVRMDAAVQVIERAAGAKELRMAIDKQAAELLATEKTRADNAERARDEEKARADKAEGALESLREEVEALRKTRDDGGDEVEKLREQVVGLTAKLTEEKTRADRAESPERLRAAVDQRVRIEGAAAAVLGDRYDAARYSDREIMDAVVEKLHGAGIPKDKSDDYARARFDAALEGFRAGELALAALRATARTEEKPRMDARAAREAMVARNRGAWRPAQKGA